VNRRRRAGGGELPKPAVALATAGLLLFVALPLAALVVRAPWSHLARALTTRESRTALLLSIESSAAAASVALVVGVPIAWWLARSHFRGRSIVRAFAALPMVVPPVVAGVALLLAFGRRGIAGQWLDRWFGIHLPFTLGGVILAEAFVAMPFLVFTVEGAIRSIDPVFEEAAATLGAGAWTRFRRITVPAIGPSIVAGSVLAWARALGEFGATITFAGNVPGRTETLPLAVYLALESDPGAAVALSLLLLAVSVVVLIVVGRRALGGWRLAAR
jgi:molybdate transport system permease protein